MWCCGTETAGSGPVKENPHVQKNSHILFQAYGLLNQKTSSVMNSEQSIYSLFYAQSLILPITITLFQASGLLNSTKNQKS